MFEWKLSWTCLLLPESKHIIDTVPLCLKVLVRSGAGSDTQLVTGGVCVNQIPLTLFCTRRLFLPSLLSRRTTAGDAAPSIDYYLNTLFLFLQIPLGRKFRSLKIWFTMRAFGLDKVRSLVRHHTQLASDLGTWVSKDSR